jgi:hypothetical protein
MMTGRLVTESTPYAPEKFWAIRFRATRSFAVIGIAIGLVFSGGAMRAENTGFKRGLVQRG